MAWRRAAQDGREGSELDFCKARGLGGGRAVSLKDSFPQGFKALNLKAERLEVFKRSIILDKPKNRKTERSINLFNLRLKGLRTC